MCKKMFLFVLVFLFSGHVFAQEEVLSVGDKRVSGAYIEPFEVKWVARQYAKGATESTVRFRIQEQIEKIADDGRNLIRFTQFWNGPDGKNLFTTVRTADANTMGYVSFHTGSSPGGFSHLDFEGRYVKGFYAAKSHQKALEIAAYVDKPVFASFGGLLYAIVLKNLKAGMTIPGFSFGGENPIFKPEKLEIKGSEEILIANKEKRRSRIITSSRSPSNKFWIDSNKAPYFLKVEVKRKDGSTTIFEIEDYKILK